MKPSMYSRLVPFAYCLIFLVLIGAIAAREQTGWWPVIGVAVSAVMGVVGNFFVSRHDSLSKAMTEIVDVLDILPNLVIDSPQDVPERRPSELLSPGFQASTGIIPFWGRAEVLSKLTNWAGDSEGPQLSILTGQPLVGKSRLSLEFAKHIPDGWIAGRLRLNHAVGAVAKIRAAGRATVVIIEASGPHHQVSAFLSDAVQRGVHQMSTKLGRKDVAPLKILIVTRTNRWLDTVSEESPDVAPMVAEALHIHLLPFGSVANHTEWARDAAGRFGGKDVSPIGRNPRATKAADPVTNIGELLARALVASYEVAAERSVTTDQTVTQVALSLAVHERASWPPPESGTVIGRKLRSRVTALLLLTVPSTLAEACKSLRCLAELSDASSERLAELAVWATEAYPPEDEVFISRPTSNLLVAGILEPLLVDSQVWRLLSRQLSIETRAKAASFLLEIVGVFPAASVRAADLLSYLGDPNSTLKLLETLSHVAQTKRADVLIADLITSGAIPASEAAELTDRLDSDLLPRAVRSALNCQLALTNESGDLLDIAASNSTLALHIMQTGSAHEALPHALEAVRLYRSLASNDKCDHPNGLALSLLTLSKVYWQMGMYDHSLPLVRQAVAIHRDLESKSPGHFKTELANDLSTLAGLLRLIGRASDSLPHAEEAVHRYRDLLHQGDNEGRRNGLAGALGTYASALWALGRHREALPHADESVRLARVLAADVPHRYSDGLAKYLWLLGAVLVSLGDYAEALPHARESVHLYQQLTTDEPQIHSAQLAGAIGQLGVTLSKLGRHAEAEPHMREAVRLYRVQVGTDYKNHVGELAGWLHNLSAELRSLQRFREALEQSEEAVALFRRLAHDNPVQYSDGLSSSLNTLGLILRSLGRYRDALTPSVEAVALRRRLVTDNPGSFSPSLAFSLMGLSRTLSKLDRQTDAVVAGEEAVRLFRDLARENPQLYVDDVRGAVKHLSAILTVLGRSKDVQRLELGLYP